MQGFYLKLESSSKDILQFALSKLPLGEVKDLQAINSSEMEGTVTLYGSLEHLEKLYNRITDMNINRSNTSKLREINIQDLPTGCSIELSEGRTVQLTIGQSMMSMRQPGNLHALENVNGLNGDLLSYRNRRFPSLDQYLPNPSSIIGSFCDDTLANLCKTGTALSFPGTIKQPKISTAEFQYSTNCFSLDRLQQSANNGQQGSSETLGHFNPNNNLRFNKESLPKHASRMSRFRQRLEAVLGDHFYSPEDQPQLPVEQPMKLNFVKVECLDLSRVTPKDLCNLFTCFGNIVSARIDWTESIIYFEYCQLQGVKNAVECLDGLEIEGTNIHVEHFPFDLPPKEYGFVHPEFRYSSRVRGLPRIVNPVSRTLHVTYHSETSKEHVSEEKLREYLSKFVAPVRIYRELKKRRNAMWFVEYAEESAALKVLMSLHDRPFLNGSLRISFTKTI